MQTNPFPILQLLAKDCLNFFYPACCSGCGNELQAAETLLCSECSRQLPFTRYELAPSNPVFLSLTGRVPIDYASALLDFRKKGIVQHLLHQLKYGGQPETGRFLGMLAGEKLKTSPYFPKTDILVPVPLHKSKAKKRGYNQSHCIAEGLNRFLSARIENGLLEKRSVSQSQTGKNRLSRWENVNDTFQLSPKALADPQLTGKHFLIVDDVLTTGATVESCAHQLLRIPESRVSVIAIASPL